MKYQHLCIKCKIKYDSDEPDPYYCESCLAFSKKIAEEVDRKLSARPRREHKSGLQVFDELAKTRGQRGFVHYKDLGITL